jgi:ribosome maturation factor RimP
MIGGEEPCPFSEFFREVREMPPAQRRASARPAGKRPQAGPKPAARPGGGGIDPAVSKARVTEVVEPVAVAAGYDLEDLAVIRMGRRHVVRVTIDRDGGLTLDDVAEVAREISAALDAAEAAAGELIVGEYQLEVSSPGVDRPLTLPRHWRRNVGRLVRVRVAGHTVVGRVLHADDRGVRLDVDGTEREVAFADLGSGRVEVEFHRLDEIDDDDLDEFTGADDEIDDLDAADDDEIDDDDDAADDDDADDDLFSDLGDNDVHDRLDDHRDSAKEDER